MTTGTGEHVRVQKRYRSAVERARGVRARYRQQWFEAFGYFWRSGDKSRLGPARRRWDEAEAQLAATLAGR